MTAISDAVERFRVDVQNLDLLGPPSVDLCPDGTVVRWTVDGRYTYAALKAPGGWYTTATREPFTLTYAALVEVLARPDVTAVTVASFPKSRSIK